MKKVQILIIIMFAVCNHAFTQDINFSQFYEIPLLRNPALAFNYNGDYRITGAFRSQWSSVTTPYVTEALGFETKFKWSANTDNYGSIGLQIVHDKAGDSKFGKTEVLPVFAYHHSMSNERDAYLSVGVMAGGGNQHFNTKDLKFDDQFVNGSYDPSNPTQEVFTSTNKTYFDLGAGVVYSSTFDNGIEYYGGISAYHINRPKVSVKEIVSASDKGKLDIKWMVSAGLAAPTSEAAKFILYADYFKQGGNNQVQGGFIYKYDFAENNDNETTSISIGSFLRWNDAIIPMIKLDIYRFGVGFTYDINASKLKTASQSMGAFEVTMSYHGFLNINSTSKNSTRCPVRF